MKFERIAEKFPDSSFLCSNLEPRTCCWVRSDSWLLLKVDKLSNRNMAKLEKEKKQEKDVEIDLEEKKGT